MASGICHLIQTIFHQCHPHPATGATRLITLGALPTGAAARWGGCAPLQASASLPTRTFLLLLLPHSSTGPGRHLCPLQGQGMGTGT